MTPRLWASDSSSENKAVSWHLHLPPCLHRLAQCLKHKDFFSVGMPLAEQHGSPPRPALSHAFASTAPEGPCIPAPRTDGLHALLQLREPHLAALSTPQSRRKVAGLSRQWPCKRIPLRSGPAKPKLHGAWEPSSTHGCQYLPSCSAQQVAREGTGNPRVGSVT